jgi:hypothetical protein
MTRGQMLGKMAPYVKYVALSSKEWAASQRPWGRPERTFCWLLQQPDLCRRHCMDTRMLDTLSRDSFGTPEEPKNHFPHPGGLTSAIGVGLFFNRDRGDRPEIDRLGAEAVALTHGSPTAFLSGAMLTRIISRCLSHPNAPLKRILKEAIDAIRDEFGHQYSQAYDLGNLVRYAVAWAESDMKPAEVMERLHCENAAQVLAGAIYACLASHGDFDRAMIIAVNHSGKSAAVGAVAGALMGAKLGMEALPDFYLESLSCADILQELAEDLDKCGPKGWRARLFDHDWDRKYTQGLPAEK